MIRALALWFSGFLSMLTSSLLTPTIRCEVVVLFDADLNWTAHDEKAELTPAERQKVIVGMFELATTMAKKYGVPMSVRGGQA